jgi:hypothetical protein
MRPIAALARVPLRFPEAIVASPGQFSMQHRVPGEDPTVGPNPRGRSTARPLRAAEQQDAGAAEGGDCRRAVDQAGGDGGAPGGVSRKSRISPRAEPATGHSPRWSPGGVGGGMGCRGRRPGSCPRGGVAQFANLDKDLKERRAVGLAAGRAAGAPTGHLASGRAAQFANRDKDPTERYAVGLAAERADGVSTRHLPPGRAAQFANLDKDPMEHRAVGLAAGRDAGGASQEPAAGRVGQCANSAKTHAEPVGATTAPPPPVAGTAALTPRSGQSCAKCNPPGNGSAPTLPARA